MYILIVGNVALTCWSVSVEKQNFVIKICVQCFLIFSCCDLNNSEGVMLRVKHLQNIQMLKRIQTWFPTAHAHGKQQTHFRKESIGILNRISLGQIGSKSSFSEPLCTTNSDRSFH